MFKMIIQPNLLFSLYMWYGIVPLSLTLTLVEDDDDNASVVSQPIRKSPSKITAADRLAIKKAKEETRMAVAKLQEFEARLKQMAEEKAALEIERRKPRKSGVSDCININY